MKYLPKVGFKQGRVFYTGNGLLSPPICSCGGLTLSVTLTGTSQIRPSQQSSWFCREDGERTALSGGPCLETRKTAKAAIHGRSVYNLHRPLTAKQPAQIHPGPLRGGGEEQSNYILKQQSEASPACKQTSSTHTQTLTDSTIRLLNTFPKSCRASFLLGPVCLLHIVLFETLIQCQILNPNGSKMIWSNLTNCQCRSSSAMRVTSKNVALKRRFEGTCAKWKGGSEETPKKISDKIKYI